MTVVPAGRRTLQTHAADHILTHVKDVLAVHEIAVHLRFANWQKFFNALDNGPLRATSAASLRQRP